MTAACSASAAARASLAAASSDDRTLSSSTLLAAPADQRVGFGESNFTSQDANEGHKNPSMQSSALAEACLYLQTLLRGA